MLTSDENVKSMILCGPEIWDDIIKILEYRVRMSAMQRFGALKITGAYRSVSEPVVIVLVGLIP